MPQQKLRPFSIAGVLNYCPECGATGDYKLLMQRAQAVIEAWRQCDGLPDTSRERQRISDAISAMEASFNMEDRHA